MFKWLSPALVGRRWKWGKGGRYSFEQYFTKETISKNVYGSPDFGLGCEKNDFFIEIKTWGANKTIDEFSLSKRQHQRFYWWGIYWHDSATDRKIAKSSWKCIKKRKTVKMIVIVRCCRRGSVARWFPRKVTAPCYAGSCDKLQRRVTLVSATSYSVVSRRFPRQVTAPRCAGFRDKLQRSVAPVSDKLQRCVVRPTLTVLDFFKSGAVAVRARATATRPWLSCCVNEQRLYES